ncbi:MAG: polyisoprenoid-binding protein, partial [Verrucomicrobia bacterium]|nr:polyisoprenoid-binding protein [Verrucomicrobiota bacterium]
GWEGTATIDRTEWGMGYGTPAVGKNVDIELNIQAHRQQKEEE